MTVLAIGVSAAVAAEPTDSAPDKAFLLKEKPADAADVIAVRKDAKDRADVVVVGRIGGRTNPWIKGAAAFSIVDRSLTPCNEMPGDTCKTPWDYCCETDLPKATVLIMVHDADGKLVKRDARKLLGVKELDTVFIQGKAKRDKAGNVSIVASKIYVAPEKKDITQ
ncbi:MAG: hypothetical protein WD738_17150 [Pirellulales bacterium]